MKIDIYTLIDLLKTNQLTPSESLMVNGTIHLDPRIHAYCKEFNLRNKEKGLMVLPWIYTDSYGYYDVKPFFLYGSTDDNTLLNTIVPHLFFITNNYDANYVSVANVFTMSNLPIIVSYEEKEM